MNPTPWTPERAALWFELRAKGVSARSARPLVDALPGPPMASHKSLISYAKDNKWPSVLRSVVRAAEKDNSDAKMRREVRAASAKFGLALRIALVARGGLELPAAGSVFPPPAA